MSGTWAPPLSTRVAVTSTNPTSVNRRAAASPALTRSCSPTRSSHRRAVRWSTTASPGRSGSRPSVTSYERSRGSVGTVTSV